MPLPKTAELLSAATSSAAPSAATDGVQVPSGVKQGVVHLESTAGSGTMTALVRMWGYLNKLGTGEWVPLGTGTGETTANTQGVLNEGNAIEEISANKLQYAEVIDHLDVFDRLYAEIITLGGTATAVDLDVVWYRGMTRSS